MSVKEAVTCLSRRHHVTVYIFSINSCDQVKGMDPSAYAHGNHNRDEEAKASEIKRGIKINAHQVECGMQFQEPLDDGVKAMQWILQVQDRLSKLQGQ